MKTLTFIIAFLMLGTFVNAQDEEIEVLITDFDGNGMNGVTFNNWSLDYTPELTQNPVMEGMNKSEQSVYYPAHTFTHPEWGDFGGFFCIRSVDPEAWGTFTYLTFKFLIMADTIATGDGIKTSIKYEGSASGTIDDITNNITVLEKSYTQGAESVWEEVFVEIPEEVKTADFKDFCVITNNVTESGYPVEMYYDDFRFTIYDYASVGIKELESQNGLAVYIIDNMINIRMDQPAFVQDVKLFDIKGSMVGHKDLGSREQNFRFPVDLQSGIYIIQINAENNVLTRKFVKMQ